MLEGSVSDAFVLAIVLELHICCVLCEFQKRANYFLRQTCTIGIGEDRENMASGYVTFYIRGAFHHIFPGFLGFGFCRKFARMKTLRHRKSDQK